jgi:hypothetical protein
MLKKANLEPVELELEDFLGMKQPV